MVYSPFLVVQYTFLLVFETPPCSFVNIPIFDLWIPDALMSLMLFYRHFSRVFPGFSISLHSPEFTRFDASRSPKKTHRGRLPRAQPGPTGPPSSGASQVKFSLEGDGSSCSCSTAAGATGRVQTWLAPAVRKFWVSATRRNLGKFGEKNGENVWKMWILEVNWVHPLKDLDFSNWESSFRAKHQRDPTFGQNWWSVWSPACMLSSLREPTPQVFTPATTKL